MKEDMKIGIAMMVFVFGILLLVNSIPAETQTLGTFKQNQVINLVQSCTNSTYSNITKVILPDSTFALNGNFAMTGSNGNYNYSFNNSYNLGKYIVYGFCDEDGTKINWVYDLYVTPVGGTGSQLGFYFLIILLVYGLVVLGIWKGDITLTLLGTIGLYAVGLYMFQFGIDVYKSWVTNAISVVTLGVAAYVSTRMAMEYIG